MAATIFGSPLGVLAGAGAVGFAAAFAAGAGAGAAFAAGLAADLAAGAGFAAGFAAALDFAGGTGAAFLWLAAGAFLFTRALDGISYDRLFKNSVQSKSLNFAAILIPHPGGLRLLTQRFEDGKGLFRWIFRQLLLRPLEIGLKSRSLT